MTGFDIIFFWVARMMMFGLEFTGEAPFRDVYIHALVRDETGAKMSKSKGNVVDPLQLIDEFGADALRFTLAAMAAQGRDIKLSTARIAGYRNFATKLWNAARFLSMNQCARSPGLERTQAREPLSRWILSEAGKAVAQVTEALAAFRFNEAADAAYRFVWDVFCDWFIELSKPVLQGPPSAAQTEVRAVAAVVQDDILKLLHPFMPFLTEEIWGYGDDTAARDTVLALAAWPADVEFDDAGASDEIGWVIDLVNEVRSFRSEMNVPAGAALTLQLIGADPDRQRRAAAHHDEILRLARLASIGFAEDAPSPAAHLLVRGSLAAIPLEGVVDVAAERLRLTKDAGKLDGEVAKIEAELANQNFLMRAKEEAIEQKRDRLDAAKLRRAAVMRALDRLN